VEGCTQQIMEIRIHNNLFILLLGIDLIILHQLRHKIPGSERRFCGRVYPTNNGNKIHSILFILLLGIDLIILHQLRHKILRLSKPGLLVKKRSVGITILEEPNARPEPGHCSLK
jgi:hypothetical protein